MSGIKKEDIRITKTYSAIYKALTTLLENHTFTSATILDICKEALISRATFYVHFEDKYDLLKSWLANLQLGFSINKKSYTEIEASINSFVGKNKRIIKNILKNATGETLQIVSDWIMFDLIMYKKTKSKVADTVFENFCAGGIINYLTWQVDNRFPDDIPVMNYDLHILIHAIIKNQA